MEAPNLDCMDVGELVEFSELYEGCALARYARAKMKAIEFRLAGKIPSAQIYESLGQEIYDELKPCQRW